MLFKGRELSQFVLCDWTVPNCLGNNFRRYVKCAEETQQVELADLAEVDQRSRVSDGWGIFGPL